LVRAFSICTTMPLLTPDRLASSSSDQLRAWRSARTCFAIEAATASTSVVRPVNIFPFLVSIGRLVEASAEPVVRVVRADEPPVLWKGAAGGAARLLRGVNDPAFVEMWEWRLEPGERHASGDHALGTRELVYVHAGSFTVVVDLEPHEVETGETIDFHADHPHEYRNDGAEPALLTMVVVMPPGERDRSRR